MGSIKNRTLSMLILCKTEFDGLLVFPVWVVAFCALHEALGCCVLLCLSQFYTS